MTSPPVAFTQPVVVRWADLDPNRHVRHSVYYDWGASARLAFLDHHGVGIDWLSRNGIGPVLFREEARFLKEIRYGDDLGIDVQLGAVSSDHRKWTIRHRIVRGADVAATLEVDGAWLDLRARKIVVPPVEMIRAFSLPG